MQSTAYALLPTENRHDGKDFEYWGADAAFFIKTFPNFTSFPHRRAYVDHQPVGHADVSRVPARLQAVHHGGVICGLGAGSSSRSPGSVPCERLAVDLRRERVGRAPDYPKNVGPLHPVLARVLSGGYGSRAQRDGTTKDR